jgi:cytidylate kinase
MILQTGVCEMTVNIPKKYIENAISQYKREVSTQTPEAPKSTKKIITMSLQVGSGGKEIAEALESRLNITVWDKQILNVLAQQSGWNYQAQMFEALDEKSQNAIDVLMSDFFGRIDKYEYFQLLPKAIYVIAQHNAIILGRGAYLLLPDSFKVRIKASIETRIHNMVIHEGLDEKTAKNRLKKDDRQRESFLKELSNIVGFKESSGFFDLEISTDRLNVEETTSIILHGFEIFRKAGKRKTLHQKL